MLISNMVAFSEHTRCKTCLRTRMSFESSLGTVFLLAFHTEKSIWRGRQLPPLFLKVSVHALILAALFAIPKDDKGRPV
jgi:hypothetical protein